MQDKPLISVLCSSFNHEKFVSFFIQSLQKQTYENWELIIIDDCSTDNNYDEINKINDSRIIASKMPYNCGSSIITTQAFYKSKGDIIVDCASDDALMPDYFQTLINIFLQNENVGVVYSPLQIINENNEMKDIRFLPDKTRIELLQDLFYIGNVLYSPGYAVRRENYSKLVPMNFSLVQHQDYEWHIKLLINTDCFLLKEPHVYYRIQEKESNSLGTLNRSAKNRYYLEMDYLMNNFLNIKDPKLVEAICNNEYKNFPKEVIPFVLGISILQSNNIYKRQWGYRTLLNFFEDSNNFSLINNLYRFEFKNLLKISDTDYYFFPKEKFVIWKSFKHLVKVILIKLHLYH